MGLMWLVSSVVAAALVTTNPSILHRCPTQGHTIMSPNGNSVSVTQTFSPKQLEPDGEGDDLQAHQLPLLVNGMQTCLLPLGVSVGSVSCMITVEYLVDFFELNNNVLDNNKHIHIEHHRRKHKHLSNPSFPGLEVSERSEFHLQGGAGSEDP